MTSQYFLPYRDHIADVKVRLDLTNYSTKADLKNVSHVDTSSFALKTNLASLKSEVDKLVPLDLGKLSDVVKNEVVKKTEFNTLKTQVDNIDTDDYVLKTKYDSEIGNLRLKILDISGLVQSSTLNSKLTELGK